MMAISKRLRHSMEDNDQSNRSSIRPPTAIKDQTKGMGQLQEVPQLIARLAATTAKATIRRPEAPRVIDVPVATIARLIIQHHGAQPIIHEQAATSMGAMTQRSEGLQLVHVPAAASTILTEAKPEDARLSPESRLGLIVISQRQPRICRHLARPLILDKARTRHHH